MRRSAPLTALPRAPGWSLGRGKEGENLGEMGRKERAGGKEGKGKGEEERRMEQREGRAGREEFSAVCDFLGNKLTDSCLLLTAFGAVLCLRVDDMLLTR